MKQTPIDKDAVTREGTFRLRRFLLIPVVITMIPALALILYNTNQERQIRMSAIRDDAQRIVQLAVVRHNRLVDSTRELLEHIVVDEEKHVDWIEAQLHQIEEVGYQNYLAQQINKD